MSFDRGGFADDEQRQVLVLGSSSRYRATLLARLGIPFVQESPDIDERAHDEQLDELGPEGLALALAHAKARALMRPDRARWLLCADQVGVLDVDDEKSMLLSKPGDAARNVDQLMALAGRTHRLVNGIVLVNEASGVAHEVVDSAELSMRPFTRQEAEAYVAECAPIDCAGGYRIEDRGILLFDRIESSDHTGIIGLPLIATAQLLRSAGLIPG